MYVEFITGSSQSEGWTANYTSSLVTGVEPSFDQRIRFFPNPAEKSVFIDSDFGTMVQLEIFDLQGKKISMKYFIDQGLNQIDIAFLSKGIYLFRFKTDDKIYTKRLVVN